MNKREYDALTNAVDVLNGLLLKVGGTANKVRATVDVVEDFLTETLAKTVEEISTRLESSPLEDPVVPTAKSWADATGRTNDLDRQEMVSYIVDVGERTGNTQFQNRAYVDSLPDTALKLTYTILKKVEDALGSSGEK